MTKEQAIKRKAELEAELKQVEEIIQQPEISKEPIIMGQTKTYTRKEWVERAENLFGKDRSKWVFRCCNCGHEQTMEDFLKAGIEKPGSKVFYSCIGRWTNGPGTLGDNKSPCNYTLGGLFRLSNVKVIDEEGYKHDVFDFGMPIHHQPHNLKQ